ncbi:hypothetical protein LshimejAT787_1400600 [Lyophyllum shimeji]|uniref:Uncharacterized protein n=1 Tax=Lyophyllum shimeji TaxID=47721 RepID=A0A9P3PXT7_LYOSH|nr:hypothetical protein LshimejAT787_1400600 [Lyophyllum shimeji]
MAQAAIPVTGVILSGAAVLVAVAQLVVALDDGDDTLKSKDHWMQCSVRNETQFDIIYNNEYFDSGTYYRAPPIKIPKFSTGQFSVCNKWGLAGVSGGNAWKVILDNNHSFPFALGFTDPFIGARKSAAIEHGSAKDGYNAASERGANGVSDVYTGKDDDGNTTYFLLALSAVTGHHSMFTVHQTEIKGDWTKYK